MSLLRVFSVSRSAASLCADLKLSFGCRAYSNARQATCDSWESNLRGGAQNEKLLGARQSDWWTGTKPEDTPGIGADGGLRTLPLLNVQEANRKSTQAYFDNTWTQTEVLFTALQGEESFYRPPDHHLRHPMMFYYAHTATLYVNKMLVAGVIDKPINPYYESIFETGVDEMKWDDMTKNSMLWPSVDEVTEYRTQVYELVSEVIASHPEFESIADGMDSKFWSLVMGFEHERIHLETSSVLIRELPLNLVRRPENFPANAPQVAPNGQAIPENKFIDVEGGEVVLGKPKEFPSFGWDNEYGEKKMQVNPFRAQKYLTTNAEMLEFCKSGGYLEEEYWTPEGWAWKTFRNIKWPTFWVPDGPSGSNLYKLRTCFEHVEMPWCWPAEINYHEAKAYANWRSKVDGVPANRAYRITTEGEHAFLRDSITRDLSAGLDRDPVMTKSGEDYLPAANINLAYGSPSPVDMFPANENGFHDVFGNSWSWNEDHLNPLPGFKVHPYYGDFSLPCFDGEHHLILGGSFMSSGDEASTFARFHFRPHFYQHAGMRLVQPLVDEPQDKPLNTTCLDNAGPYGGGAGNPFRTTQAKDTSVEDAAQLQEYLHFHFGSDDGADPHVPESNLRFQERCAELLLCAVDQHDVPTGRILDIGCALGRSSIEFSRKFDQVLGMDVNPTFVDVANNLIKTGEVTYTTPDDGEQYSTHVYKLPSDIDPRKIEFVQGDAQCLAPNLGLFDAVSVINVIDRLSNPTSCLGRIGGEYGILKPGGIVLVTSPFSWEGRLTPKELWIGGREGDVKSVEALKNYMESQKFELLHEEEMPFTIRQNARRYELLISNATVWKLKN